MPTDRTRNRNGQFPQSLQYRHPADIQDQSADQAHQRNEIPSFHACPPHTCQSTVSDLLKRKKLKGAPRWKPLLIPSVDGYDSSSLCCFFLFAFSCRRSLRDPFLGGDCRLEFTINGSPIPTSKDFTSAILLIPRLRSSSSLIFFPPFSEH